MTQPKQSPLAKEREERAAVAMRENLRRRKQQQQARGLKQGKEVAALKEEE